MTDLTPHALILEHNATPIVDAAAEALAGTGWVIWSDGIKAAARDDARTILRAALPWEPELIDSERRVDALLRELYPEKFNAESQPASVVNRDRPWPTYKPVNPE
jgi:hypothetical protein